MSKVETLKAVFVVQAMVSSMLLIKRLLCAALALETRIGPNVFTSKTLLKLSLSSLARAVSADAWFAVCITCCLAIKIAQRKNVQCMSDLVIGLL